MKCDNDKYGMDSPQMYSDGPSGWGMFTPEVSWFVYDFFKHELNGYEKLIFYCYYIQGRTLMDIGESANCTFQNIGATIKKIEKKLHHRWKHKSTWKVPIK